ncbi:F0F1 ATP synthase subunit A [Aureliella helgolandensis]|mgnify:CR=1 FL=1|uniref:ATP synthase subunit a n=1 Tax=Aureliella helgolandensis TaxID=2527968 RepID=A0A518GE91_9BACT|nr:F0F1 ATP synthase subunit A [Aureliella helgolandensis]QDV26880.1 ATP synthase subunit a [Aureliella helgolandensis]|tara:strand:+ start:81 stop:1424 length:1344 start_codon:yes stop_codon:yes gene_type:complete
MASDPLLHIKDSYYFDVPRKLWRADYDSPTQLADQVGNWVIRNDADYQDWEADRIIEELSAVVPNPKALHDAKHAWHDWQHAQPKERHGRPFDQYVEDSVAEFKAKAEKWAKTQADKPQDAAAAYLADHPDAQLSWMLSVTDSESLSKDWAEIRHSMDDRQTLDEYLASDQGNWSAPKLTEYNQHLSGKVFVPQPFGTLRNAYEKQSGFAISRYMIIEVIVAVLILVVFKWLAGKIQNGDAPKGKVWNLLESFLAFIKTDIVEKGIDPHDSPKFMPLFWTMFMFILGCNLMGMLPWVGSPTAALAVTAVLALFVFLVGSTLGIRHFGLVGYLKNLCPELGLPIYLAIFIIPMVWVIEFASLFIKHAILAIRLLANMVAGHMVLLGVMGLAFGAHAATMHAGSWTALSIVAILGTTLLSFMELFVAFLQAYVFTLLAAFFVGSATHHH